MNRHQHQSYVSFKSTFLFLLHGWCSVQLHAWVLRESLLWAEVEEGGKDLSTDQPEPLRASLVRFAHTRHVCVFLQVEEEATDKDNKNCSKDGMCGKVRLCLPLSGTWLVRSLDESSRCLSPCLSPDSPFLFQNIFQLLRHRRDGGT